MSMTKNKPHAFASQPWLTIPFENRSKTPIDELVDILLSLPGCLSLGDKMLDQDNRYLSGVETSLHKHVLSIISQLDYWICQYCAEVVEPDGQRRTFLTGSSENMLDARGLSFDAPQMRTYSDVDTAAFSAMYDAANLIAFSLLLLVSPPIDKHVHRIHFHAQSILSSDDFVESNDSPAPAGRSLLMVFPLKIASLWAPLLEQREYAVRKLQNWDREDESHSICRFAAPVFLQGCTTDTLSSVYHANVAAQVHLRLNPTHLCRG